MIKSFKLDRLKKMSKHEVELVRGLYGFLPATDVRDKLHVAIRKALMKHLGYDIRYYLSSVDKKSFNEIAASLPENPILGILGLTPIDRKAVFQIDHHIANLIINKLLGGSGAVSDEARPLTETEQGVLQYLIMQILSGIYALAGKGPRVHFRFERFAFGAEEIGKFVSPGDNFCLLTIEVSLFDQSGFVKIAFPYPFLEEMVSLPGSTGKNSAERNYFSRQLQRLSFLRMSAWAEVGNSLLSHTDIKDLGQGDVVLFDETDLKMDGKKPGGKVLIHFGEGEGGVKATLIEAGPKKIKCKLDDIVK